MELRRRACPARSGPATAPARRRRRRWSRTAAGRDGRRRTRVSARMPILGQDHMREPGGQTVDDRHDLVAARNRQARRRGRSRSARRRPAGRRARRREIGAVTGRLSLGAAAIDRGGESVSARGDLDRIGRAGSRPRKGSGSRWRSRGRARRMSASDGGGRDAPAARITGASSGSPPCGSPSIDRTSPAMRPSGP